MKVIVRRLNALDEGRCIATPNWSSRRLLLRSDGMGFSLHDTIIRAGTSTPIHYANHLEAVYCVEGSGALTLRDTGETIAIEPGTMYALDRHEAHVLSAETDMRMVCVFNPPVVGPEVHDENGVYPLLD